MKKQPKKQFILVYKRPGRRGWQRSTGHWPFPEAMGYVDHMIQNGWPAYAEEALICQGCGVQFSPTKIDRVTPLEDETYCSQGCATEGGGWYSTGEENTTEHAS